MGLLIWKIIGWGILAFFALGIISILLRVLAQVLTPLCISVFYVLCVVTYPITVILRSCGLPCPSLFALIARRGKSNSDSQKNQHFNDTRSERLQPQAKPAPPKSNPWEILGVPKSASVEAIAAAYRQKMKANHPDKVADLDPALQSFATQRTIVFREAYEALLGDLASNE